MLNIPSMKHHSGKNSTSNRNNHLFLAYCLTIGLIYYAMLVFGSSIYMYLGIVAVIWGVRSPLAAIQSMFILVLFSTVNTGIYCFDLIKGESSGGSVVFYIAIFSFFVAALRRELMKAHFRIDAPMMMLFLLLFIVVVSSPLVSYAVDVSIFKIIIFSVGVFTLLLTGRQLAETQSAECDIWLQSLFVSLPWLSLPLMFIGFGYSCNLAGFQAWVGQPQSFSVIMALIVTWLSAKFFYSESKHLIYGSALLVGVVELFLSGSRTGVGAVVISVVVFTALALNRRPRRVGVLVMGIGCLIGLALITPAGRDFAISFIRKREAASEFQSVSDQAVETRAALVQRSWENFLENPVFGMGFGTAGDEYALVVQRDPILGLPVSAPTEKGVFWVAALEEIGVVGSAAMFALFSVIVVLIYRSGNREWLAIVVCALVLNFGEAMLFSLGGIGALLWLLIAIGSYARRTDQ